MAKVYSPPVEIGTPETDYGNWENHMKLEEDFVAKLKEFCERTGTGEYKGVEYRIPFADGNACYMVLHSKPLTLIHIPVGDAWDSPWASRARLSDIKKQVEFAKAWKKLSEKQA